MVVPVEEEERALAGHNVEGVPELRDLGEDEELHPEAGGSVTPVVGRDLGHGLLEAHVGQVVHEVRHGAHGPHEGEGAEEEVPHGEVVAQVEALAGGHVLLAEVDRGLSRRRQGGDGEREGERRGTRSDEVVDVS